MSAKKPFDTREAVSNILVEQNRLERAAATANKRLETAKELLRKAEQTPEVKRFLGDSLTDKDEVE